jgi:hypothetical protein
MPAIPALAAKLSESRGLAPRGIGISGVNIVPILLGLLGFVLVTGTGIAMYHYCCKEEEAEGFRVIG